MRKIPLFEEDDIERKFPRLAPTTDPLTALKNVKKALAAWDGKTEPIDRKSLIDYINKTLGRNGDVLAIEKQ